MRKKTMMNGDKVKPLRDMLYLDLTRHHIGVVVSQSRYKVPNGKGWDVEVRFGHKRGTVIIQGDELSVVR
jgi:hypothetical protein